MTDPEETNPAVSKSCLAHAEVIGMNNYHSIRCGKTQVAQYWIADHDIPFVTGTGSVGMNPSYHGLTVSE